jgi:hypothetical protein
MNLTYIARVNPELPCDALFEEQEWKVLFCTAKKTKKPPDEPYPMLNGATPMEYIRRGRLSLGSLKVH